MEGGHLNNLLENRCNRFLLEETITQLHLIVRNPFQNGLQVYPH